MRTVGYSVVIKPFPEKDMTESGIIIPFSVVGTTLLSGEVVSVGRKVQTVKAGDVVYFRKTLSPTDYDGYYILAEGDLSAIKN